MIRSTLYSLVFDKIAAAQYAHLFERLPRGAHLLDVGIGNGVMLDALWRTIRERELHVTGLDISEPYLKECAKRIDKNGLYDLVSCHQVDVIRYLEETEVVPEFVYFGASFMLLPHQERILELLHQKLPAEGRIYFSQTLFAHKTRFGEWLKPKMKYFTTIDFGKVTYRDEFFDKLHLAGFDVVEQTPLRTVGRGAEITFVSIKRHVDAPRHVLQAD